MSTIYDVAMRYRTALARDDAQARRDLLRTYNIAWAGLETEIARAASGIRNAPDAHGPLATQGRLVALRGQLAERINDLVGQAADSTERRQERWIQSAQRFAAEAVNLTDAERIFNSLPDAVLRSFVGVTADGSALRESFDRLGRDIGIRSGQRIEQVIVQGIVLGQSPDEIARRARLAIDAQNVNPAQLPQIVRRVYLAAHSAVITSFREATRAGYAENEVTHWQWVCARQVRTCAACWALDGRIFPVSVPQSTHPACRCTSLPVFDPNEPPVEDTGPEAFAALDESEQAQILGPAGFEAYQAGEVELGDFVGVRRTAGYGDQLGTTSVARAVANAQTRTRAAA